MNRGFALAKLDGWVIVRQRGSHVRLQKHVTNEVLKIIVPAHKPIKRSVLSHILKQARLTLDESIEIFENVLSALRQRDMEKELEDSNEEGKGYSKKVYSQCWQRSRLTHNR
ncbi:MAG: type II toxin-antitoxin system HicA family toxin [Candidatus Scalindua sp.]|nr:type II toxin-antitoxin system HicA family toxin [Candidatus Scalindua sp.]